MTPLRRILYFAIYFIAAVANLWPVLMLAMSSSFAGISEHSIAFLVAFAGLILAITLLAVGASALMADRKISQALLLGGPGLSLAIVTVLGLSLFRNSAGVFLLILPETICSLAALIAGIFVFRSANVQGAPSWPQ